MRYAWYTTRKRYIYYFIQCHGKYTGQHNQSDIPAAHNVKVRCNTVENVPFDAKMWSDTCSQTSSDPRSELFSERVSSRKTLSFEEQIMSKDKYSSIYIFTLNWGCCVYYPSNLFLQHAQALGHISVIFSSFSWSIFVRDQSRDSELKYLP